MKKFMFAAMAALAITSCSQNEEMDAPSQKVEIGFNSFVGKATRATPTDNENFDNFKVYAYNTGKDVIANVTKLDTKVFMPGVSVNKQVDGWAITGTYYWPLTDNIQFFAYSPMTSTAVSNYAATNQYPTFEYTVGEVAAQEDLLAASATDMTKDKANAEVTLTFKHLLTQINFSAKGSTDGYTYTVKKIEISGVNSKSTFTFDSDGGSWGNTSAPTAYVYAGNYTDISGTTLTPFSSGSNALMLMPQSLPADAKIVVAYMVSKEGSTIFDGTGEVSLEDVVWAANNQIRYTLTLSDNGTEIVFKPGVGEWDTEGNSSLTPAVKP